MLRFPGQIDVIAVGKVRKKHWRTAQDEYLKRLTRYAKVNLVELKDASGRSIPDSVVMAKEGEAMVSAAGDAARRVLLTPTGRLMTSKKLARFLHDQVAKYGRLAFLIGGPLGVSDDVIAAAEEQLSLSPLTFPHELARVMLLEQLYRACTILNNEGYHK